MSSRRVKIVILCEDSQQEAFTRRFLAGMGWNPRELRVEKSPSAKGSAEQWVREQFPNELKIYRQRRSMAASALIVVIDADKKEVQGRIDELTIACNAKDVPSRAQDEAVAFAVPKRNIETWIHYLNNQEANEEISYPKLDKERGCRPAVIRLVKLCKSSGISDSAPLSLAAACDEYRNKIKPLL